ncbi:RNA pyrophosphohydrolase [Candidatus Campbellbacteria bacterium]|nr:MAG: RNA pyrophosphohydrolase [Candidatus Campbellbacteria bacterium]
MLLFEGPDDKFRASAGAFITNKERTAVLAFERISRKGSRQLPQGGIKIYEKPVDAIYRELKEETGLESKDLLLIGEYPEWITYELPERLRSKKHGRGQTQKFFFFEFKGDILNIDLQSVDDEEFSDYFWVEPIDIVNKTVDFRKPIYKKLISHFEQELQKSKKMSD